MHVDYRYTGALQNPLLNIYDSNTSQNLKIRCQYFDTTADAMHFDIDFSTCPREFTTNFITFEADNMDAACYMHVVLIGWAE
jgi:hypothetical protein